MANEVAALGLQLAWGHPDLRSIGGAQDAVGQAVGPDEVDVEETAQFPPGIPHAHEDTGRRERLKMLSRPPRGRQPLWSSSTAVLFDAFVSGSSWKR